MMLTSRKRKESLFSTRDMYDSRQHSDSTSTTFTSSVWFSNRSRDKTMHRTSMLESTKELLI
uniref:Uncharacterized protein n=1 Tax=Anguilla anguilla TaxID=7936 RepID=A0A0E9QIG1_ANGAN